MSEWTPRRLARFDGLLEVASLEDMTEDGRASELLLRIVEQHEDETPEFQRTVLDLSVNEIIWLAEQALDAMRHDEKAWNAHAEQAARSKLEALTAERDAIDARISALIDRCQEDDLPI